MVGEPYMAGDVGATFAGTFYSRYDRTEAQLIADRGNIVLDTQEAVDIDEAWAPAGQAPRAP